MALMGHDILQTLICSSCHKYLSVLPVKVYKNGGVKCGRCCRENDGGAVSLYERLVIRCLFKCVNRFEGCNTLLTPSEVLEHEGICKSGHYYCPKCEIGFSGTAYQLFQHYTHNHPNCILKKPEFDMNFQGNSRERYLYLKEDMIFFFLAELLASKESFYVSAVSLKPNKNIIQQFSLSLIGEDTVILETKEQTCTTLDKFHCDDYFEIKIGANVEQIKCRINLDFTTVLNTIYKIPVLQKKCTKNVPETTNCTVDIQTTPVENMPSVELTDDFKKKYPGFQLTPCGTALLKSSSDRIELVCSNCLQFTGCNVFNCNKNHIICWDCNAWCGICATPTDGWNAEISVMNELLLFPCRWNCGKALSGGQLKAHEWNCDKPTKDCPVKFCRCSDSLPNLRRHLAVVHLYPEQGAEWNILAFFKQSNTDRGSIYFFHNNFFFTLMWVKRKDSYELTIVPCENIAGYEMTVILKNKLWELPILNRNPLMRKQVKMSLQDNPKFYLKRIIKINKDGLTISKNTAKVLEIRTNTGIGTGNGTRTDKGTGTRMRPDIGTRMGTGTETKMGIDTRTRIGTGTGMRIGTDIGTIVGAVTEVMIFACEEWLTHNWRGLMFLIIFIYLFIIYST